MKSRVIITSVPGLVAGGMILFLGCGAESQKTGYAQSGIDLDATAAAVTPATANPSAAPAEPIPKIVTAPSRLSPGVDEIVQLAQAGVGDEVLQAYIENSPTPYKLNVDEILYLHDLGLRSRRSQPWYGTASQHKTSQRRRRLPTRSRLPRILLRRQRNSRWRSRPRPRKMQT